MLALLLIPALLGLALFIDSDDDSDDTATANGADDDLDTTTLAQNQTDFDGGAGDERAVGNALDNALSGGAGNDVLVGNGGDDDIEGNTGDDTLYGGSGNDTVSGNEGDDLVFLGAGADEYAPGDTAASQQFDAGDDTVNGGVGDDVIVDLLGSNLLTGSGGDDVLAAIDALRDDGSFSPASELGTIDTLRGGTGDDALVGDDGDVMSGGTGSDDFYAAIDESRAQDSVVITDFDVARDTFAVVRLTEDGTDEDVTFTQNAGDSDVRALFNGEEIAILRDVTLADLDGISVSVFSQDDLDARLNA